MWLNNQDLESSQKCKWHYTYFHLRKVLSFLTVVFLTEIKMHIGAVWNKYLHYPWYMNMPCHWNTNKLFSLSTDLLKCLLMKVSLGHSLLTLYVIPSMTALSKQISILLAISVSFYDQCIIIGAAASILISGYYIFFLTVLVANYSGLSVEWR